MVSTLRDLEQGKEYLDQEQYEDAFRVLLPCAEKGELEAQSNVGMMYQLGLGVTRDIKKSIKWLTLAAERGSGEAAHNLGTLYLTCEPDVPHNSDESIYWYKKAKRLNFNVGTDEWLQSRREE